MLGEQLNTEENIIESQFDQQIQVLDINDWISLYNSPLFKAICDQLPVGISICIDPSCCEIKHNQVAAGFFRINAWDNLSHSSIDIPPLKMFADKREMLPEEMPIQKSLWSGQSIKNLQVDMIWTDGIKKTIMFNSRPLFDPVGTIIGAIATSRDITEQKAVEEALRESETRSSLALSAWQLGIWDTNLITGKTVWNKEFFCILGYQPGEVDPDYEIFFSRIHPEDRVKVDNVLRESLEQGGEYGQELRILWPDGTIRWLELRGLIEMDNTVGPVRHYGVIADITNRKHREQDREQLLQEIADERSRFQAIIEALPVGLFMADTQGKLLLANDAAYDICQGDVHYASDAYDYSFYKCWWSDTGERLASEDFPLLRSLKGEIHKDIAIDFERFDGTMSSQLISSAPIVTAEGKIKGSVCIAQDITERMLAQKALLESEARFRKVFYDNPDAMIIIDMEDGRRMDVNHKYQDLLGYSCEEVMSLSHIGAESTIWAEGEEHRAAYLRKLREEGLVQNCEFKIRSKSGNILTVLASSVLMEWKNRPCRLTIIKDITKERKLELEFRAYVTASSETIYCMSADWRDMLELQGKDFLKSTVSPSSNWMEGYIHPDDQPFVSSVINDAIRSKSIFDLEHRVLRIDGSLGWTHSRAIPIINASGEIQEWFGTARDVTRRKEAEEALQESERKFRKLFFDGPDAMSIIHMENGRYIDANQRFLDLLGYCREDITDANFTVWAESEDKRRTYLKTLQEEGSIQNYEVKMRTKSGNLLTVLVSTVIMEWDNKLCRVSLMKDITKEKEMEKELARLDRLNLIGEMAASIGHEIRNPMTCVRGFLQMLSNKTEYTDDLPFFDLMIEELDRANSIISEYLNMAKNKRINLERHFLDALIMSIYPIIHADALSSDMNTALELTCLPALHLDENEIRQLILNMSRNSLESMSSGGTLTIGTMTEGGEIVLYIKDEGHGIDASILENLGKPFITTKDNGTGLGIAVCYSIASRHNARIDIDTSPQGTTFYVRFPSHVENLGQTT